MRGSENTTVQILDSLFSPHLANLQKAMGRATARHSLLTNNLANVNTPGFKRKDVSFDVLLAEQATPGAERMKALAEHEAQAASDRTSIRIDGNNVDMEREVMSVAETELRYEALTQMTQNYFGELKSAIREGR
ncbi:MAG: flagellar basal body rod protein FlgB [Fimbriimonas ginsengisoli]|uniref:Flagellar basal body rod protein FlgB n=1 Tax=Fimbriimonas ginsengisoli TaxID=1005039 RepID=A0A931LTB2_FIMGI|nr:flagellar basal body rod protein FlgB [Fimbriimonas ginsengisoli]